VGGLSITAYLIRRAIHSVFIIVAVLTLIFFVTRMLGDPVRLMLPEGASEAQVERVQEQLGLDRPLPVQFVDYFSSAIRGDFGDSMWLRGESALGLVLDRLPRTLYLSFVALALAFPLAIVMGVVSALYPRTFIDRVVTIVSLGGVSIANFWLALMMILVFSVELGWFPTSGYGGINYVILPAIVLALTPLGRLAQLQRSSMLETLSQNYVVTARSKGLRERAVIVRHTLRNASIPTITLGGHEIAGMVNGAIVVETVFGWPGIGTLLIQAINNRDMPVVVAATFAVALMVILINLFVDLMYAVLDPRIAYS
jgi:peptide/nickel transport system permease protein